jgi:uncharacterized Tic20 family protein
MMEGRPPLEEPDMTVTDDQPSLTPAVPSNDARNWAILSHLSAFVAFLGVPSPIGPLVIWLLERDDPYVDYHAKEALNFNISFLIYGIVSAFLIILLIGLLLLPIVFITWFVLVIVGAVKAGAGEYYRYPMTIRFVS